MDRRKFFLSIERRGERIGGGEFFMRWAAGFWPHPLMSEAETAPLAICQAALLAVGWGSSTTRVSGFPSLEDAP
jgi:hypothetical protein